MKDFITYAEELAAHQTRTIEARQRTLCDEFELNYRYHGATFKLDRNFYTKNDLELLREIYGPEGWYFKLAAGDIHVQFNNKKFPLSENEALVLGVNMFVIMLTLLVYAVVGSIK